jgi:general secretion pathway protein G
MNNLIDKQNVGRSLNASTLAESCNSESEYNLNPATRSTASRLAAGSSVARMNRASGFTLIEVMVVIVI